MSIFKTALVTTALVFGSATTVFAQDAMVDKAKDMAVDKGVDMAKDKAMGVVGDDKAGYIDPAAKAGKDLLKGESAKDAVLGAVKSEGTSASKGAIGGITDTSLSSGEAVTAGKVIFNGGSKEDAAIAVAKGRAKDSLQEKAEGFVSQTVAGKPSASDSVIIDSPSIAAPATPQVAVNCPSGTTAQPNGTCMITGDYK